MKKNKWDRKQDDFAIIKAKGELQRLGLSYKDLPKSHDEIALLFAAKFNLMIVDKPKKWLQEYYSKKRAPAIKAAKDFYKSAEWIKIKKEVLNIYGCMCMKCHAIDTELHVDHIKPRSLHPHLELEISNLQVLCKSCNELKSNKNEADYRPSDIHSWKEIQRI